MTPEDLEELAEELCDIDTAEAATETPAAARVTVSTDD
jgi:hypothetical protein